jgi:hypothetical protein
MRRCVIPMPRCVEVTCVNLALWTATDVPRLLGAVF